MSLSSDPRNVAPERKALPVIKDLLQILLFPLALVYALPVWIRNKLYDKKVYKSTQFDLPVISVGNLSVGGTGKTPHIEYLIRLLHQNFEVATLSRGYKRKTSGFILADLLSTSDDIGDEPRQYKRKFPGISVSVGEDRLLSIPELLGVQPDTNVILLDDAFQSRKVRPGLSILLTEFNDPFTRDRILPLGRLREARSNYKRADLIVVTKCPENLTPEQRASMQLEIKPQRYQKLYFSCLRYGSPYSIFQEHFRLNLTPEISVILVCGIAKTDYIEGYLKSKAGEVFVRNFGDHHNFDRYDLENVRELFQNLPSEQKVIITTEKDASRLEKFRNWLYMNRLPVFCLPVEVYMHGGDAASFNRDVLSYINYTLFDEIPDTQ